MFIAAVRAMDQQDPRRGSDMVRSTGWCPFSKKNIPAGFCPMAVKRGSYDLEGVCPGGGYPGDVDLLTSA